MPETRNPLLIAARELQARLLAGDFAGYQAALKELASAGVAEPLSAALAISNLTTSNTTSSASPYKVPGDTVFLANEVQSFLQSTAPNSETTAFASGVFGTGTSPPSFEDRMLIKALNCQIDFLRTNLGSTIKEFLDTANANPSIADLHPLYGQVRRLRVPKILPPATEIQLGLKFLSAVAAVVGQNTNYGVIVSGIAITM